MSAGDFIDGARDVVVLDEGFIGGIEEDHGIICEGVIDPCGELLARGDGSSWIIGKTEIDDIDFLGGRSSDKAVAGIAAQIDESGVGTGGIGIAGISGHDVGIDINGINGSVMAMRLPLPKMSRILPVSHFEPSEMKISSAEMLRPAYWCSAMASRRKAYPCSGP